MKKLWSKYKQSGFRKEIDDTIWVIGLQGLNYVIPILVIPYLMVTLGAEKFGYYGFALAVCQWLMLIVDFGFNLSATKRIAVATAGKDQLTRAQETTVNIIFSNVFYAKIGLLFLSFIVLTVLAFVPQFEIYRKAMLLMFTMVVGNAFLFVFLFQGLGKIKWMSIINGIARLSVLPLTFLLVKGPNDYEVAILLQGMVSVVAAVISGVVVFKKKWARLLSVDMDGIKTEMKESWPLFVSIAATSVYTSLFVVYLGLFAESDEVGCYSAGDKLMRAAIFVAMTPALQVFYPKVSQLAKTNMNAARRLARGLLTVMAVYTALWGLFLFFGSEGILSLLGKDYVGGKTLFRILSFVPIWIGVSGILGQCYLLAMGGAAGKKMFERSYLIAAMVATTSTLVLTPWMHGEGSAIAMVLTEASVAVTMWIGIRRMKLIS